MASKGSASFERHFQDLPDPRIERTRKHPLINTGLGGAGSRDAMANSTLEAGMAQTQNGGERRVASGDWSRATRLLVDLSVFESNRAAEPWGLPAS